MAEITKKFRTHVVVWTEYERGWGRKDFMANDYSSKEEALKKVDEENAKNNLPQVPDYYIMTRYVPEMSETEFELINK